MVINSIEVLRSLIVYIYMFSSFHLCVSSGGSGIRNPKSSNKPLVHSPNISLPILFIYQLDNESSKFTLQWSELIQPYELLPVISLCIGINNNINIKRTNANMRGKIELNEQFCTIIIIRRRSLYYKE